MKEYNLYKFMCRKEDSFINISFKDKIYCASFIADKKYNSVLDMIIDSKTIDCISKYRILELCETLNKKPDRS